MATAEKVELYPTFTAHLGPKGITSTHYGCQMYPSKDVFNDEYGFCTIALPPLEVELLKPDMAEVERAIIHLLGERRNEIKQEHVAVLTRLQIMENTLLRIAAPQGVEVLDPVTPPPTPERDLSRCTHCGKPKSQHFLVEGDYFCTDDAADGQMFEEDDFPL